MPHRVRAWALFILAFAAVSLAPAVWGANQGQGSGSGRIQPFVEVEVTDGSIAPLSATPSSSDPGPRAHSNSDKFRFNGRWTNTQHVVLLDVSSATDGLGSSTKAVQGTTHTIADWVRVKQDSAARFGTVRTVGVADADAGSYTAPGGFTKDSQGTVTLRTYADSSPEDGGTARVVYWIYDATAEKYMFDRTDKDFTNANGELTVYPVSKTANQGYVFPIDGLYWGIEAVAGAESSYVPTVAMAWYGTPGSAGGKDFDAYVLIDFPSGAAADTYSYTLRATIHSVK